ncbi:suppressor of cytokine signaling 5-like [Saccoglossus kowalevskii]|uniref:Suppressor of cytokine signaling 5-like n=1 Tax=Saccoglossus kowalevskii TaxID=10224 RepID=A0ABM0GSU5_SACKO|nr:PREDICTED: suppressor of cytokine signaling 5-like [Saccoglossus kowalevskii]
MDVPLPESVQKVDCQEPATRLESGSSDSSHTVHIYAHRRCLKPDGTFALRVVHSQIDYNMPCLAPDLQAVSNSSFYWGRMSYYEAEAQLDGKPEGTFLLRDSAQNEHLFTVSFRQHDSTRHVRVKLWNNKFSIGMFSANTVCEFFEHYKDPNSDSIMLTIPLPRRNPFTLLDLCRAVICTYMIYDDIKLLCLPSALREYLREYHYTQKSRVRTFEVEESTETEVY